MCGGGHVWAERRAAGRAAPSPAPPPAHHPPPPRAHLLPLERVAAPVFHALCCSAHIPLLLCNQAIDVHHGQPAVCWGAAGGGECGRGGGGLGVAAGGGRGAGVRGAGEATREGRGCSCGGAGLPPGSRTSAHTRALPPRRARAFQREHPWGGWEEGDDVGDVHRIRGAPQVLHQPAAGPLRVLCLQRGCGRVRGQQCHPPVAAGTPPPPFPLPRSPTTHPPPPAGCVPRPAAGWAATAAAPAAAAAGARRAPSARAAGGGGARPLRPRWGSPRPRHGQGAPPRGPGRGVRARDAGWAPHGRLRARRS